MRSSAHCSAGGRRDRRSTSMHDRPELEPSVPHERRSRSGVRPRSRGRPRSTSACSDGLAPDRHRTEQLRRPRRGGRAMPPRGDSAPADQAQARPRADDARRRRAEPTGSRTAQRAGRAGRRRSGARIRRRLRRGRLVARIRSVRSGRIHVRVRRNGYSGERVGNRRDYEGPRGRRGPQSACDGDGESRKVSQTARISSPAAPRTSQIAYGACRRAARQARRPCRCARRDHPRAAAPTATDVGKPATEATGRTPGSLGR